MKRAIQSRIFYPLLFAWLPILSLYFSNVDKVQFNVTFIPTVLSVLLTVGVWVIGQWGLKNIFKSALFTSFFTLLFFSYTIIRLSLLAMLKGAGLVSQGLAITMLNSQVWMLIVLGLELALLAWFWSLLTKLKQDLSQVTQFLNWLAVILIALSLFTNGFLLSRNNGRAKTLITAWMQMLQNEDQAEADLQPAPDAPDIYYIIVDGYARQDILKQLFNYDNSEFLNFLQQQGFYVAEDAHSNYDQTALSLSSSLNMMYLNDWVDKYLGSEKATYDNRRPLYTMVIHNRLMQYLHHRGYKIVAFPTGYDFTEFKQADEYRVGTWTLGLFDTQLINNTALAVFLHQLPYIQHRARIRYVFDQLPQIADIAGPTFTFAHVISPHPPFVFDKDGNPRIIHREYLLGDASHFRDAGGTREEYIEGYRGQVQFVNHELEKIIPEILARSSRPPIIIIQGDHGSGSMLDWNSEANSNVQERMSNLNAYYFPDQDYQMLYPSITPVNSFRVVLDQYLGEKYPLLPDRVYFSLWDTPYNFDDVTDKVQ